MRYFPSMKKCLVVNSILLLLFAACVHREAEVKTPNGEKRLKLELNDAQKVVKLPVECLDLEYPNKLNQVIGSDADLRSPKNLHPAFYGCFDWHSAVHGHWSLVRLLKEYPNLKEKDRIINGLKTHLSKENIQAEIAYFKDPLSQGFERMYGWAWLLKLADELETWNHPDAKMLSENLQPLADVIVNECITFLPKLHYPIRVGTHNNTAFAMSLIFDYAVTTKNNKLKNAIRKRALDYYENDKGCPLTWEPSGTDFLSPCFEEANLMRRVMPKDKYKIWLDAFLPELKKTSFKLAPAIVTDRTDGQLVHLDGLNFSRAWCLYGIAETLPEEYGHLTKIGNQHINYSFKNLMGDSYEGGHWLASFALLALAE
jgi:Protein of unknown function (DUF2891)